MSDPPPLQRPATARRRADPEQEVPPPPTADEQARIERQLIDQARLAGAEVSWSDDLAVWLVTWSGRGLAFNYAAGPRWSETDWSDRARRVAERLADLEAAPSLVLVEELGRPMGLAERLVTAGWLEIGRETILWTRRAATVPHLDPALRIEAVTASSVAVYEATERAIFGIDPAEASDRLVALERGLAAGGLRVFLVRLHGEPVATARLQVADGLASLHGVGVTAHRRRAGYGALVTTVATRAGLATGQGLVWLSVDPANEAAVRLYTGLDYRPVLHWRRLLAPALRR